VACYEQSFEQHLFDHVLERTAMAIAAVIPGPWVTANSSAQVYARRRLMAAVVVVAIALAVLAGGGHVVANRESGGRCAPTVRPAIAIAADPATRSYVVQPGDTLWSIGERFHGQTVLADYVDALVAANGGSQLQVSQSLTLP
jgi:nucleoid-associated protein YgaU